MSGVSRRLWRCSALLSGIAVGVVALLGSACMIANPGFKLIDGEIAGAGTSGDATSTTSGTSGTGGSGPTGPTGPTGTGMEEPTGGTGAVCMAMTPCYTGSPGTQDVGTCRGGLTSCTPLGEFDVCEGEVVPGLDPCATADDEDCNGSVRGCAGCEPGAAEGCYSGPPGTEGVGECIGGSMTCSEQGAYGPCVGEVTPTQELCGNGLDDDCDATADDGC